MESATEKLVNLMNQWLLFNSFNAVQSIECKFFCDQKYSWYPNQSNNIRVHSNTGITELVNRTPDNGNIALFGTQLTPLLARNTSYRTKLFN